MSMNTAQRGALPAVVEREEVAAEVAEPEWAAPVTDPVGRAPRGRVRRGLERGMVTAEYAVGILAAISEPGRTQLAVAANGRGDDD